MMTTIFWALLFFGLLWLIKLFFNSQDRKFHEEEMKKHQEMLKKHNMTQEEFEQRLKEEW